MSSADDRDRRTITLIERSRALREGIRAEGSTIVDRIGGGQRFSGLAKVATSRPVIVIGALVLAWMAGPRRVLRFAGRAFTVLDLLRRWFSRDASKP